MWLLTYQIIISATVVKLIRATLNKSDRVHNIVSLWVEVKISLEYWHGFHFSGVGILYAAAI